MLSKFAGIETKEYVKLDREIGDALHQVYKVKSGSSEALSAEIFKVLDEALGTKKTPNEAKNYKKLLAAVQKSKLMHPTEITALFRKANRFLSKESTKKEKAEILKNTIENLILEGPSSNANMKPKEEAAPLKDEPR